MTTEDSTNSTPTIEKFRKHVVERIRIKGVNKNAKFNEDIKPECLIFDRNYAQYRHEQYPYSVEKSLLPGHMEPTWINVILIEAKTKKQNFKYKMRKFDLLNNELDSNENATISDLLKDLNTIEGDYRGDNAGNEITMRKISPILKGIEQTTGHVFSDIKKPLPVTTIKLISLLYKIYKNRSTEIFPLIAFLCDPQKRSLEFGNKTPNQRSDENTLLIADLISYLNILIPTERLLVINQVILDADMMWNTIAENSLITNDIVRYLNNNNKNSINADYERMAIAINYYQSNIVFDKDIQPAESLQTLLRTLHFKNTVSGYLNIYHDHHLESNSVKSLNSIIENICVLVSKERNQAIHANDMIISINEFYGFIKKYENEFIKIVREAKGKHSKHDQTERTINRAKILTLLHIFNAHGETDTNKRLATVSDCVAALYTIGFHMKEGKHYEQSAFGQKTQGKSVLTSFDNCKNIEELIENDNIIPQGAKYIMHIKFCQTLSFMRGNSEGHYLYTSFHNVKLEKIAECLNSNNAENILKNIMSFLDFCASIVPAYKIPPMPESMTRTLQQWANQSSHKPRVD